MSDYWSTLGGNRQQAAPGVTLNTIPPPWAPPPPSGSPFQLTPGPAPPPPMDPIDRDMLIKTLYGEAANQPQLGQAGVAHAIMNRVAAGGYNPPNTANTIANVVTAPAQGVNPARGFKEFSPWNAPGVPESNPTAQHLDPNDPNYLKLADVVDKSYYGGIPDPTGGATHYYGYMPRPPKWAGPLAAQNLVKIGGQTFVGGASGPGQRPMTVGQR